MTEQIYLPSNVVTDMIPPPIDAVGLDRAIHLPRRHLRNVQCY